MWFRAMCTHEDLEGCDLRCDPDTLMNPGLKMLYPASTHPNASFSITTDYCCNARKVSSQDVAVREAVADMHQQQ